MSRDDERFVVKEKQGGQLKEPGLIQVIVDQETGVNYLWIRSGYASGLTPLLNADGKPVVTKQ